jgi:hypothetical protein
LRPAAISQKNTNETMDKDIDRCALADFELRTVRFPFDLGVGTARVLDMRGREIEITMRPLAAERREKLIAAVRTAYRRLKEPNEFGLDKEMFVVAVRGTGYVETDAEGVGPFTAAGGPANPITILHRDSSLWENETELCVAVLHEAVHLLDARSGHNAGKKEQRTGSRAEAIHDLNCYAALDYDVPSGHQAFGLLSHGESASATPERTDPCPCGSGKKYKRCCG